MCVICSIAIPLTPDPFATILGLMAHYQKLDCFESLQAHLHVVGMLWFMSDITRSKTHKCLKRMLFNQTKRDRIQIVEGILMFKATNDTKRQITYLLPVGFLQKDVCVSLTF